MKDPSDWYYVSIQQVAKYGGSGLLHRYGNSLTQALRSIYPQHNWKAWRFSDIIPHQVPTRQFKARCSKTQYLLFRHVQHVSASAFVMAELQIFPHFRIVLNHLYAQYAKQGLYIEFDVSICAKR